MDLREYLFHNRLSIVQFSEMVYSSRTHMSAIVHGKLRPSKRLAKLIENATNGEVKAESLLKEKGTEKDK